MDELSETPFGVVGICIGIHGVTFNDEITFAPYYDYVGLPIAKRLSEHFGIPVILENEANLSVIGEKSFCFNVPNMIGLSVHAGVGVGILIDNKLYKGFNGNAGEFGHTILSLNGVPCTCGNKGCLERYTSATALIRMAKEAVSSNPDTQILRMVSGDISRIKARTVIDAARDGDPLASEVYTLYIDQLAQAIANIVNFIDPEVIVIGGGVSNAGDFLLEPLRKKYRDYVVYKDQPIPEIKLAVLGAKAGIIGAAMLS
jgi:glucokinase